MINIFTKDAKINSNVEKKYKGMDRFEARKSIVSDMDKLGLLEKIEDYTLNVPRGDRSGAILEPYITDQWYVSTEKLAKPAIDIVKSGELNIPINLVFSPPKDNSGLAISVLIGFNMRKE